MVWYLDVGPASDVAISSRIRLARNLKTYPFPELMQSGTAKKCYAEIRDALYSANSGIQAEYLDIPLNETPEITIRSLVERRLLSEDILKHKQSARAIISKDESISIMLGEEDHIRIQAMQPGLALEEAYLAAEKISLLLEEKLPIAYDNEFGFLTACPTNIGTGMRASVMLHLPALGQRNMLQQYFNDCRRAGLTVRGKYGEHSEATGYIFQISNQFTMGVDESTSLKTLKRFIVKIIELERESRAYLWEKNKYQLADRIGRSYGILSQARLINTVEAQNELSTLRLGVAMNMFDFLTVEVINNLEVNLGEATLQMNKGQIMSAIDRDYERAKFIRNKLHDSGQAMNEIGGKL